MLMMKENQASHKVMRKKSFVKIAAPSPLNAQVSNNNFSEGPAGMHIRKIRERALLGMCEDTLEENN